MTRVPGGWVLTPQRMAVHEETATAVVADVHLGYAQARRRRGEAVPADDLGLLFAALEALKAGLGVRRLVVAGDLLEDASGRRLALDMVRGLAARGLELAAVVPGNHDRGLEDRTDLPVFPGGYPLGDWTVVHGDKALPAGKLVLGHFHPCLRWGGLTAACYLMGRGQLVLPAFSPDASGVNVRGSGRWRGYRAYAVAGEEEVLDFGAVADLSGGRRQARSAGYPDPGGQASRKAP